MSVLGWIVVGLIAGVLARWIVRDDRGGCIYSLVIGVLGALVGGWLMSLVDNRGVDEFSIYSILVAALGAILLLLVVHAVSGSGRRSRDRW